LAAKVEGRVFALIPASIGDAFYAVDAPAGPVLPSFATSAHSLTDSVVSQVEEEARAALGLDLHLLSCPSFNRPSHDQPYSAVVLFELTAPDRLPPAPLHRLAGAEAARLLPPNHAGIAQSALVEWASGQFPRTRVSWARPGWLAAATDWLLAALAEAGLAATGPVEVRRRWSLSCLLRLPTTGGDVFFKAVPPLFAVEPVLTQYLATLFPGRVPAVLATSPRHWLLMRAFTGRALYEYTDIEVWTRALRGYAEMQVALSHRYADLTELGCPMRPLATLPRQVRLVLDDTDALQIDQPRGLSEADHHALRDLLPVFDQACAEMTALGLPDTLEHGDLHAYNIFVRSDNGYVFYDWTDGCLTQPLLCLAPFLEVAPPEGHVALCAAYLDPWRGFADAPRLERALALARVLSPLHLAVSYYNIRRSTEPSQHWELAGALAYFLREARAHARQLE
jgi:hypothetical protein